MPSPIVEQLRNGVKVICADGSEVVCKPMQLSAVIDLLPLRRKLGNHELSAYERNVAHLEIVEYFAKLYPELAPKIAPGDVHNLLLDFFWSATGAYVPAAEQAAETTLESEQEPTPTPTTPGMSSSSSMLPAGELSPV